MEPQNQIPVSIQIQTKVDQAGQIEEYFFDVAGKFVQIAGTLYLRYEEPAETAEGEKTMVTVKIEPDGGIQLIRSAENRTRLSFLYREERQNDYRTPHGIFPIHTFTKDLHVSLKDQPLSGKIEIQYELLSMKQKIGDYEINIQFTA